MRLLFYIITLSMALFLGFSANAKSTQTYVSWGEVNQLYHLNYEYDDDLRSVMILPNKNPEKSCICVCLPSYEGTEEDAWVCTQTQCSYQNKKCKANIEDYSN